MSEARPYILLDAAGRPYQSVVKGLFGGHRGSRGYGTMHCRAALSAIARGGYVAHRVFFADELTAIAAGYRPCAVCLPERYALWNRACAAMGLSPLVRARALRRSALAHYRALLAAQETERHA